PLVLEPGGPGGVRRGGGGGQGGGEGQEQPERRGAEHADTVPRRVDRSGAQAGGGGVPSGAMNRIRKVAVLGAGVMGSGIAAHVANAGLPVLLMDIVPPKAGPGEDPASRAFRNKLALGAVAAMKKHKPAPLFTATAADLIEPGNFEDDLPRLLECDWVVEAVKEDLAVKQALFSRVEPFLKSRALVSSNTSGLSVKGMCEG